MDKDILPPWDYLYVIVFYIGSSSTQSSAVMLFQYVLIASENVTTNAKLLQLLESRST